MKRAARPFVGDSPGFGELRTGLREFRRAGGDRGGRRRACADFDQAVKVTNHGQFHHFEIARAVHEADVVINLPKLKTHGMMTLTGAVKNLFGCIPGRRKVQWHFNAGVNRDAFARMLVELSALSIRGSRSWTPFWEWKETGRAAAIPARSGWSSPGSDPVAVDVVSGTIVGADPALLYVIRAAAAAGIGETRLERIDVLGESLSRMRRSGSSGCRRRNIWNGACRNGPAGC